MSRYTPFCVQFRRDRTNFRTKALGIEIRQSNVQELQPTSAAILRSASTRFSAKVLADWKYCKQSRQTAFNFGTTAFNFGTTEPVWVRLLQRNSHDYQYIFYCRMDECFWYFKVEHVSINLCNFQPPGHVKSGHYW